jgi:DsbC/DsbD-like thiol-disulfide interchange protein
MRRIVCAALFVGFVLPSAGLATEKPYRVTFMGDAYTGDGWMTGVRVELDEGWKTYWRMPGESGLPPEFAWTTSVPADVQLRYPAPGRFADASGETVGYKHEVVFPVAVKAGDALNVSVDLDLFFAVCKEVCIPADAKASIALTSAAHDPQGSLALEDWLAKVPALGTPVTRAAIDASSAEPVLSLALAKHVDDIFVESATSAYFRKPTFSADGLEARLVIDNVKDAAKLKGAALTVTVISGGLGLEQQVTLP